MIFCLIFFLVPETVRELNVDSADSDKVTINWQPPETDAGITKYKVMLLIQPITEHCPLTRPERIQDRFRFHLIGNTIGIHPKTRKLDRSCRV